MRTKEAVIERIPASAARGLRDIGAEFHARGWSLGTSSNFSRVLARDPLRLLITASGKDKGRLGPSDFVVVDADGRRVDESMPRPSAETKLHAVLARRPTVGAILHTHSVWGTILSDVFGPEGALELVGYEMLKGLAGVSTHEHRERVTIFENTQDIASLAGELDRRLDDAGRGLGHGFLMRNHGLYAWGADLDEARRHVEVFEFLFEVVGRRIGIDAQGRSTWRT